MIDDLCDRIASTLVLLLGVGILGETSDIQRYLPKTDYYSSKSHNIRFFNQLHTHFSILNQLTVYAVG